MENFTIYNPTSIHFGKNVLNELAQTIKQCGNKVLLVYGKGSVVKNGYYKLVTDKLTEAGIEYVEYSGIKPNPVVSDVKKAIQKGIEEKVELVLAIGGGSVIDSAKFMALCIPENLEPWEVVTGKLTPKKALPIITILTLAATGTEMNQFAVVQNEETKEKLGYRNTLIFPKHSFIDPQLTYSVSKEYTAYGITDIIAHAFENYFGNGASPLADRFVASIVKESMYFAPLVLNDLKNYEYRANILLQSSYALNGTTVIGKTSGDWGVHAIGHTLSILFDMAHGASLSIAYPAWFKLMKNEIPDKIKRLSELLFDTDDIDVFIKKMEDFFKSIKSPVTLIEAGIEYDKKEDIINLMKKNKVSGYFHLFDNYETLVELMYGN